MASSYGYYKEEVKEYIKEKYDKDSKILDVGAGCGTYYELLKDSYDEIDGVEVFKENIDKYDLGSKYKHIYNKDIREFKYKWYDLVIFGDVLEHLEVEEAQEVLEYALEHSKGVVVALPYCYEQGEVGGNVYEIHKQDDLTKENVLERYPELELLIGNEEYGYYVKKGDGDLNENK